MTGPKQLLLAAWHGYGRNQNVIKYIYQSIGQMRRMLQTPKSHLTILEKYIGKLCCVEAQQSKIVDIRLNCDLNFTHNILGEKKIEH